MINEPQEKHVCPGRERKALARRGFTATSRALPPMPSPTLSHQQTLRPALPSRHLQREGKGAARRAWPGYQHSLLVEPLSWQLPAGFRRPSGDSDSLRSPGRALMTKRTVCGVAPPRDRHPVNGAGLPHCRRLQEASHRFPPPGKFTGAVKSGWDMKLFRQIFIWPRN